MRWSCFILSMYFVLLSVMPCSDAKECVDSIQTSISAVEAHEGHSHEAELCSPFCACLCCGQLVDSPSTQVASGHFVPASAPLEATYKSGFPLEVHLAIWQPPQIS